MSKWPITKLREAGEISQGITLGRKISRSTDLVSVPYLRVANVQDGRLDLREVKTIDATPQEIEKWRLRDGDLLLTEGGDLDKLGRGTCWRNQIPNCIHQNHIFRVRLPVDRYDPDFVALQTASPYGKSYFFAHAKKTTGIATINQRVLGDFPLLSPSLSLQRDISAHIRAIFGSVAAGVEAAQAQLSESNKLINSLIRESTLHPLCVSARLGDVLDEVKEGIGSTWNEYPVFGASRSGIAAAKESIGKNPGRYKPVTPGTVFYNPMRIMIGSIALVEESGKSGITSPDYVVLRGRQGKIDSRWFYHWLRAPEGEQCINSLARGAVRERMLFNRLAEGRLTLPPLEVQVRMSKALDIIRPMRNAIQRQLSEFEQLPARVLAQAF